MSATLKIAIAAEFELAEKIADFFEQSQLEIEQLAIVEIYPFGEEQGIRFNNKAVPQLAVEEVDFAEFNYLLFAGDIEQAKLLAQATEAGAVVVDVKGLCANLVDVPVVVPSLNEEALTELRQGNMVALPDPQVSQLALALAPWLAQDVQQLFVTSLLPASYQNGEQVSKLVGQTAQLLNGIPLDENQSRLAFDVFPAGKANLSQQLQKIFPQLNEIQWHQVQVPVFYGLAQQVNVTTSYSLDLEQGVAGWQQNAYVDFQATGMITPVTNGEQENHEQQVKLHIANLQATEQGVGFWTVADEQRFNLAFMAVKLTEAIFLQGY